MWNHGTTHPLLHALDDTVRRRMEHLQHSQDQRRPQDDQPAAQRAPRHVRTSPAERLTTSVL